jgi:hypothetical protein
MIAWLIPIYIGNISCRVGARQARVVVFNRVLRVWEAVSFQFEDIREEDCQRGIHRGAWAILHNEFSKFGSVFGELLARGIEWRVTYRVLWSLFFRSIKF